MRAAVTTSANWNLIKQTRLSYGDRLTIIPAVGSTFSGQQKLGRPVGKPQSIAAYPPLSLCTSFNLDHLEERIYTVVYKRQHLERIITMSLIQTQIVINTSDLAEGKVVQLQELIANFLLPKGSESADGWTRDIALDVLRRLKKMERTAQVETLRQQVENGGRILRQAVYDLNGYAPDRQLRGYTRAINLIVRDLIDDGTLPNGAANPMETVYDLDGESSKQALAFEMPEALVPIFNEAFGLFDN